MNFERARFHSGRARFPMAPTTQESDGENLEDEPLHGRARRDAKAKMLYVAYLQSFLRKGVSLGHAGLNLNLKDLMQSKVAVPFQSSNFCRSGLSLVGTLSSPKTKKL